MRGVMLTAGVLCMTTRSPLTLVEAARKAGATAHQVRIYVTADLVRPCAKTARGYLRFEKACVACLRLITSATRVGMRIAEIGTLVSVPSEHQA